jgi:hypothetical protein
MPILPMIVESITIYRFINFIQFLFLYLEDKINNMGNTVSYEDIKDSRKDANEIEDVVQE